MVSAELLARARARLGTVLNGKYRLDDVLGVGGMAVVFAATHRNGRAVAVKMLHTELSLNSEIRSRFLKEGQAANAVRHPGVVAVLDDDITEDGTAFLVMEFLDGSSLDALQEAHGGRLPLQPVVAAGIQLLDVLAAAAAHGIVHRDVKPANLYVTRDGHLKVLDFGIARVKDLTSGITQSGITMGTPGFMAPEQAAGRTSEIDGLTDVWAVGATIYTLLAGRLVHDGESAQEIAVRSATQPVAPLSSILEGVPEAISIVVDRALAFEKRDRWPSARAMQVTLTAAHREVFGGDVKRKVLSSLFASAKRAQSSARMKIPTPMAASVPEPLLDESETIVSPQIVDTSDPSEANVIVPTQAPRASLPEIAASRGAPAHASSRHRVVIASVGAAGVLAMLFAIVALRSNSQAPVGPGPDSSRANESAIAHALAGDGSVVIEGGSVPTVSFDSLPHAAVAPTAAPDQAPRFGDAARSKSAVPVALDAGHQQSVPESTAAGSLSIAATGGNCDVTVDGVRVGVTPLASLQVASGRHHVVCSSAEHASIEVDLDVASGATTRYRFSLTAGGLNLRE